MDGNLTDFPLPSLVEAGELVRRTESALSSGNVALAESLILSALNQVRANCGPSFGSNISSSVSGLRMSGMSGSRLIAGFSIGLLVLAQSHPSLFGRIAVLDQLMALLGMSPRELGISLPPGAVATISARARGLHIVHGPDFINCVVPRFEACRQAIEVIIVNTLREAMGRRVAGSGVSSNSSSSTTGASGLANSATVGASPSAVSGGLPGGGGVSVGVSNVSGAGSSGDVTQLRNLIRTVGMAVGLPEIRGLVTTRLEPWLTNPKLQLFSVGLTALLATNCRLGALSPHDLDLMVSMIYRIRYKLLKPSIQSAFFESISHMAKAASTNLYTIINLCAASELRPVQASDAIEAKNQPSQHVSQSVLRIAEAVRIMTQREESTVESASTPASHGQQPSPLNSATMAAVAAGAATAACRASASAYFILPFLFQRFPTQWVRLVGSLLHERLLFSATSCLMPRDHSPLSDDQLLTESQSSLSSVYQFLRELSRNWRSNLGDPIGSSSPSSTAPQFGSQPFLPCAELAGALLQDRSHRGNTTVSMAANTIVNSLVASQDGPESKGHIAAFQSYLVGLVSLICALQMLSASRPYLNTVPTARRTSNHNEAMKAHQLASRQIRLAFLRWTKTILPPIVNAAVQASTSSETAVNAVVIACFQALKPASLIRRALMLESVHPLHRPEATTYELLPCYPTRMIWNGDQDHSPLARLVTDVFLPEKLAHQLLILGLEPSWQLLNPLEAVDMVCELVWRAASLSRDSASRATVQPWLVRLVESSDVEFELLPVQCLCEYLLCDAISRQLTVHEDILPSLMEHTAALDEWKWSKIRADLLVPFEKSPNSDASNNGHHSCRLVHKLREDIRSFSSESTSDALVRCFFTRLSDQRCVVRRAVRQCLYILASSESMQHHTMQPDPVYSWLQVLRCLKHLPALRSQPATLQTDCGASSEPFHHLLSSILASLLVEDDLDILTAYIIFLCQTTMDLGFVTWRPVITGLTGFILSRQNCTVHNLLHRQTKIVSDSSCLSSAYAALEALADIFVRYVEYNCTAAEAIPVDENKCPLELDCIQAQLILLTHTHPQLPTQQTRELVELFADDFPSDQSGGVSSWLRLRDAWFIPEDDRFRLPDLSPFVVPMPNFTTSDNLGACHLTFACSTVTASPTPCLSTELRCRLIYTNHYPLLSGALWLITVPELLALVGQIRVFLLTPNSVHTLIEHLNGCLPKCDSRQRDLVESAVRRLAKRDSSTDTNKLHRPAPTKSPNLSDLRVSKSLSAGVSVSRQPGFPDHTKGSFWTQLLSTFGSLPCSQHFEVICEALHRLTRDSGIAVAWLDQLDQELVPFQPSPRATRIRGNTRKSPMKLQAVPTHCDSSFFQTLDDHASWIDFLAPLVSVCMFFEPETLDRCLTKRTPLLDLAVTHWPNYSVLYLECIAGFVSWDAFREIEARICPPEIHTTRWPLISGRLLIHLYLRWPGLVGLMHSSVKKTLILHSTCTKPPSSLTDKTFLIPQPEIDRLGPLILVGLTASNETVAEASQLASKAFAVHHPGPFLRLLPVLSALSDGRLDLSWSQFSARKYHVLFDQFLHLLELLTFPVNANGEFTAVVRAGEHSPAVLFSEEAKPYGNVVDRLLANMISMLARFYAPSRRLSGLAFRLARLLEVYGRDAPWLQGPDRASGLRSANQSVLEELELLGSEFDEFGPVLDLLSSNPRTGPKPEQDYPVAGGFLPLSSDSLSKASRRWTLATVLPFVQQLKMAMDARDVIESIVIPLLSPKLSEQGVLNSALLSVLPNMCLLAPQVAPRLLVTCAEYVLLGLVSEINENLVNAVEEAVRRLTLEGLDNAVIDHAASALLTRSNLIRGS
ncbi:uncharacterized protein DEA37_0004276 [Paragonimus westermani]|uniref:Uncharacterized protein n=1 Tax=Paragonimus westermani TaxID=34504 RepID=A0A5J4NQB7_9TREM|nr:uncharacterized protein DEA37_0004276 [Paragonimus westermani]